MLLLLLPQPQPQPHHLEVGKGRAASKQAIYLSFPFPFPFPCSFTFALLLPSVSLSKAKEQFILHTHKHTHILPTVCDSWGWVEWVACARCETRVLYRGSLLLAMSCSHRFLPLFGACTPLYSPLGRARARAGSSPCELYAKVPDKHCAHGN